MILHSLVFPDESMAPFDVNTPMLTMTNTLAYFACDNRKKFGDLDTSSSDITLLVLDLKLINFGLKLG